MLADPLTKPMDDSRLQEALTTGNLDFEQPESAKLEKERKQTMAKTRRAKTKAILESHDQDSSDYESDTVLRTTTPDASDTTAQVLS